MSQYKPVGLEDRRPFGKHKGTKISVLLYSELAYMRWLIEEFEGGFDLDDQAYKLYQRLNNET